MAKKRSRYHSKPSRGSKKQPIDWLHFIIFGVALAVGGLLIYASTSGSGASSLDMGGAAGPEVAVCSYPPEHEAELNQAWVEFRPQLEARLRTNLAHNPSVTTLENVEALYRTFYEMMNFVRKTTGCVNYQTKNQDYWNLDQIAQTLAIPFEAQYLTYARDILGNEYQGWICDAPYGPGKDQCNAVVPPQSDVKQQQEMMLDSANYLYLVATAIRGVSIVPDKQRTEAMKSLLLLATPISATYSRWLGSPSNLMEISKRMLPTDPKHYFGGKEWTLESAVTPAVAGGAAELTLAYRNDDVYMQLIDAVPIRKYVDLWAEVLNAYAQDLGGGRYSFGTLVGANTFYNRCAGYTDASAPKSVSQCSPFPVPDLKLDISHFRIWEYVFESFIGFDQARRFKWFDPEKIMAGLAKQFREQVWNGDTERPKFTNYFSGSVMNGWYLAKFDSNGNYQAGSGVPPYGLGSVVSWYLRMGQWDPEMKVLQDTIYRVKNGFAGLSAQERLRYLSGFVAYY